MNKITKKLYIFPEMSSEEINVEDILAVSTADNHDILGTQVNDIL